MREVTDGPVIRFLTAGPSSLRKYRAFCSCANHHVVFDSDGLLGCVLSALADPDLSADQCKHMQGR